ncbi:MAG: acetylornithine transaminase [Pseudomonadota bacterium]
MGMSSEEIKKMASEYIMNTYGRYDLALVRGKGALVYDPEGKEYLDFVGGLAVTSLGHSHPQVARAVADQALKLVHVSNLFYTEPQVKLARLLVENSLADKVFFCNSGAEANEAAIKLARKYSWERYGPGRFKILTMENSFHGRTMTTLSATAQAKIHHGFEPLVQGFEYLPFNDLAALEKAVNEEVCAIMIEPIQGEGGVNEAGEDYLAGVSELCALRDVLLIFDEVQVGLGRTGTFFAYQQFKATPDIVTLAKALANGLPMGACLAREEAARAFGPGSHATTFGGTPLVSAAALTSLETILSPGFLDQVVRVGRYFKDQLKELAAGGDYIKEVRGRGLILGLELTFPGAGVVKSLMNRGFLINCTMERVLRFLPPLTVTEAEIDRLMPPLSAVLAEEAAAAKGNR